MYKVAVIAAADPLVHRWLGPSTLLERLADKLEDVRELNEVILVGNEEDQIRAAFNLDVKEEEEGEDGTRYTILPYTEHIWPDFCLLRKVVERHPPPDEAAVYLFCDPLYPFLDRGRLEDLLTSVAARTHTAAFLAYASLTILRMQATMLRQGTTIVPAALAVDLGTAWCLAFDHNTEPTIFLGNTKYVQVDPLETINVRAKEGLRMSDALVAGGEG